MLFDRLVTTAMRNQNQLGALQVVVEKELLHHDILRELSKAGLLAGLTFFGGTCLRMCYGSNRLSEDLDFTGGADFDRATLEKLADVLVETVQQKYELAVTITAPMKDTGNTDTWRLKVETRPARRDISKQVINIDVCAVPSYQRQPMMLKNHYGVDMGTSGLIVQVETREEILADKILAFGLRPNRIKNRDLWDLVWLNQHGIKLPLDLLPLKLRDHHCETGRFLQQMAERRESLCDNREVRDSFVHEMRRFLPASVMRETIERQEFWVYLVTIISDYCQSASDYLLADGERPAFRP